MYERMLNKEIEPSFKDLSLYCGNNKNMFNSLNSFLLDNFSTTQEICFPYGNEYGWCIAHRKGKKLICNVFAEADAFTVMLRLSNQQCDESYDSLQTYTKQCIDTKYPCGKGGWIHYRVLDEAHLTDIKLLLSVKCK